MRIAHISDIHFFRFYLNPLQLFSKQVLGNFNYFFRRRALHNQSLAYDLIAALHLLNITHLIITGDYTCISSKSEFLMMQKYVKLLKDEGFTVYTIPGNHDSYTKASEKKKSFYHYLSPFVDFSGQGAFNLMDHRVAAYRLMDIPGGIQKSEFREAGARNFEQAKPAPKQGLCTHKLDAGGSNSSGCQHSENRFSNHERYKWWLVCVDCAHATPYSKSTGLFASQTQEHLQTLLASLPKNASVILASHFPYDYYKPNAYLERGDFLKVLVEGQQQIRIFMHGHRHQPRIEEGKNGLLLLDSGSISLKSKSSFNLVELTNERCVVSPYHYQNTTWNLSHDPKTTRCMV